MKKGNNKKNIYFTAVAKRSAAKRAGSYILGTDESISYQIVSYMKIKGRFNKLFKVDRRSGGLYITENCRHIL